MPSDPITLTLNLTLDPAVEMEQVEREVQQALRVSPEIMQRIREGSFPNVSMGCRVPFQLSREEVGETLDEMTQEVAGDQLPQGLPPFVRDSIISGYLETQQRLMREWRAVHSPFHPDFGCDLSALRFKPVQGPLPPWCIEGTVVLQRESGLDFEVTSVEPDKIVLREVTDDAHPLIVFVRREQAIQHGNHRWWLYPLPPTRYDRLMED